MRDYLVFGSNDNGETLVPLGAVTAPDHDSAKKKAREAVERDKDQPQYETYGTCPVGNWSFSKLTSRTIVDVEDIDMPLKGIPGQMTVEEVLDVSRQERLEEAREALATAHETVAETELKPGEDS
jgi:hypothetical protein